MVVNFAEESELPNNVSGDDTERARRIDPNGRGRGSAAEGRAELPVSQTPYIRYTVADDFAYGDLGVVVNRGLTGSRFVKPSWDFAGSLVARDIRGLAQFEAAKHALALMGTEPASTDTLLSNFVGRVAAKVAGREIEDAEQATAEIDNFLDSIRSGPKEQRVKVELLGLILRCPGFRLPDLLIRQTRREDLEKDVLDFPQIREAVGAPYPRARSPNSRSSPASQHSTTKSCRN
jgi:hypothetical protein